MTRKEYIVCRDLKITLGWSEGIKYEYRDVVITWNPEYTKVVDADLIIDVRCSGGGSSVRIRMNDNMVFEYFDVLSGWEKHEEKDVAGILVNGRNKFGIEVSKYPIWHPGAFDVFVTMSVVVEYEGEPPEKPEYPPWMYDFIEWVSRNKLPLAIVGAGSIGGVIALAGRRGEHGEHKT